MRNVPVLPVILMIVVGLFAPSPATAGKKCPRIAVLEFDRRGESLPPDAGAMVADMLVSALGHCNTFTLQERVLLKKVLAEQKLALSGVVDPASGAKIGHLYGVDALVAGVVMAWDGRVTVTARLIDSDSGTVTRTAEIRGADFSHAAAKISTLARILAGTATAAEKRNATESEVAGGRDEGVKLAVAGAVFKEKVTGMEFVIARGDCYQMGQEEKEKKRLLSEYGPSRYRRLYGDEGPRHRVCLDDFWLGRAEVTNAQFRLFRPEHDSLDFRGHSLNLDNQPVTYVSWKDARDFAAWLSAQYPDRVFSLPSEAEWEFACRAGTDTPRFWGWDADEACRYGNVLDRGGEEELKSGRIAHDCDDGFAVTAPVASFAANPLGLYDMLGNVWEWTADTYLFDGYRQHSENNPLVNSGSPYRVRRGGSFKDEPGSVRCANRGHRAMGAHNSRVGFRLKMMLTGKEAKGLTTEAVSAVNSAVKYPADIGR